MGFEGGVLCKYEGGCVCECDEFESGVFCVCVCVRERESMEEL